MGTCRTCSCSDVALSESELQDQIAALGSQVRELTRQLADHLGEDHAGDRRARGVAERLERIIGGREVDPGAFPECCLIGNTSARGYMQDWFCTGSLIHPRIVLSADHCIERATGRTSPNSIAIGIDRESDVQVDHIIRVYRIFRHPDEDVALLVLARPAAVAPIAVAAAAETAAADQVQLVGFGNTDPAGTVGFGVKRQVTVPMHVVRQSADQDLSDAEATLGFDSFSEFVAGRKGSGKDSCNGDSGGPAYALVDGQRKLCGATSRATDEHDDACGDGGVYVRVDALAEWIESVASRLR